jgi:hypothetical protein
MSDLAIGFTNKMFTLWSVSSTPRYEEGRMTGHDVVKTYYKNLSMTESEAIAKAKEHGCTNLIPDHSLRGTSVWKGFVLTAEEKAKRESDKLAKEKADAELKKTSFTFGKYEGETYEDISINDENYFMWAYYDRSEDKVMRSGMDKTKLMKAEAKAEANRESAKASLIAQAKENGEIVLTITGNPRQEADYGSEFEYASQTEEGILVFFQDVKQCDYNGYEYFSPIVNGKGKRVKNKTLTVTIDPSYTGEGLLCIGLKKA